MALSLTAEQKNILKLFSNEDVYIIPSYQRPYSWEYDQCNQLCMDLLNAYTNENDYFIGNIILARSEKEESFPQVVDGQQRLLTIWLLLKVMSLFMPNMKILDRMLFVESWTGKERYTKIKSHIFESDDRSFISFIADLDFAQTAQRLSEVVDKSGYVIEKKCKNRIEANFLLLYSWINEFFLKKEDEEKMHFFSYLLNQIFMLPIELKGKNINEANDRALIIFETINNRGMNLEDADIFKAKLYDKAKSVGQDDYFIKQWADFKQNVINLNITIDDVFRYYSHIIRGRENIISSEKNLRDFFTNESFSPLSYADFQTVLDDLMKIIEILQYIKQEEIGGRRIGAWIQLVDAYTNQYPKFAVVTYLYKNGYSDEYRFGLFLQSLVRYCYYVGSSTTVKYEIYNMIKLISNNIEIPTYFISDIKESHFEELGRLNKGYALLTYYVNNKGKSLPYYDIDRIFRKKDFDFLPNSNARKIVSMALDCLGNYLILDMPHKNGSIEKKVSYYSSSSIDDVHNLHLLLKDDIYKNIRQRDKELKRTLVSFFKKDYNE